MTYYGELGKLLLRKADQDRYVMDRLIGDQSAPDDVVGSHAQQAVEKMIKAALAVREIEYPRTHQIEKLATILRSSGISYPPELSEATTLTSFAVEFRYDLLPIRDDAAPPFDRRWAKRCVDCVADWAASLVRGDEGP